LCFAALSPTFALYADRVLFADIDDAAVISRNVGLIFMVMGLTIASAQGGLIRPLVARLGERRVIVLGQFVLLLSSLLIPFTTDPFAFVAGLIPFAVAYGISDPSLQSLVTRFGNGRTRGQLLGAYQSVLSLAYIIGPIWAGYVFENLYPQAVWQVTAVLLTPALILSIALARRSESRENVQAFGD
jgi:MFS family permease